MHCQDSTKPQTPLQEVTSNNNACNNIVNSTNIYNNLEDNDDTTPQVYKTSWLLDTAASGNYGDKHTRIKNRKKIWPEDGISINCANSEAMHQTEEGQLPFDRLPKGAQEVQIFDKMHSPLISGGKAVQNGCQLIFDKPNAHIISG